MFDIEAMSEYEILEMINYYRYLTDGRLNYETMLDAFEKDLADQTY